MKRTQRLLALALVLALLAPCFGVALADGSDPASDPDEVKLFYDYGNATYYRVRRKDKDDHDKDELEESAEHFYKDLMSNPQQLDLQEPESITYLFKHSTADLWTMVAGDLILSKQDDDGYLPILDEAVLEGHKDEKVEHGDYKGYSNTPVVAGSVNQAKNQLVAKFRDHFPSMNFDTAFSYPDEATAGKEGPVIATAVHLEDGNGSYRGAVVYFTDFNVVALLPDAEKGEKPYVKHIESSSDSSHVYASDVTNRTLAPVTASQTIENDWSATVTSTISKSEKYSLTVGVSLGASVNFGFAGFNTQINVSGTEAVEEGWSKSEGLTQKESISRSVSVALPPYTSVLLKQQSGTATQSIKYNCPIGLTFTARIVGYKNDPAVSDMDKHCWKFGPDARADLYRRGILNRDLDVEVSSAYSEAVNWSAVDALYYWEGDYVYDPYEPDTGDIPRAAKYVPFGKSKAEFRETMSSMNTDIMGVVPLEPLTVIRLEAPNVSFINDQPVSYGNFNYLHADMKVGDSSYTRLFTLSGKNPHGADYHGFNPLWGTWKVVHPDKDSTEWTGDDAPVRLEAQNNGTMKYIAQKPGTCLLKYYINEESYPKDAVAYFESQDKNVFFNGEYIKNEDLDMTAALEITVTENDTTPTHTIEVTGSYTGEVRKAAEKLEENGLAVSICGEDGKEIDEKYTWEAKELPAKGISLSKDGTVSFTKPGTFHVRAVCEAHSIKSDWVEITAAEKGLARIVTPPTPRDGLYDGQEQALLVPGEVEGGTMVYCLDTENSGDTFTEVGKVFSADVPTASQAGTYKIWYKALGDANHTDSQVSYLIVTVLKSPVQPVKPDSEALVYNGEAQTLVQAGNVAGGTLQYFVGDKAPEKDGDWSAEMPTGTDAGEYTVWYRVKGDKNHNDSEPASLKVTIEKRPLLVTPNDAAKTFGDADPVLTWTADGLVGSDSLLGKLVRTKGENVGTYAIARGSLAATDNYALVVNEGLFTIKPKKITVKAKDATAVYGDADPELEYTVAGLVGNDTLAGRLSRKDGVDVGEYPITQGTLAAPGNYTLAFEGAVFTITKRPVTVTAKAASKRYGDADPELEYTVEGLVEPGQLTGKLVRKDGEKVGAYSIGKGTLAVGRNYDMTFEGAKFTITPRTVTVTANNASKTVGSADPKLTFTVEGLVNGDKLKGRLSRVAGEAPGSYAITQGTLRASKNYAISFNGAKLTITGREKLPAAPDYTLLAKMRSENDSTIFFSWSKVKGAVGYDVFFKDCDGDQDYALYRTVMGLNCRIKELKKGVSYKGYVWAWTNKNGGKAYIGEASPVIHCIAGGYTETQTNAKSVSLNKSKLTLVKGKTSALRARAKGEKSGRQLLAHADPIRYYSSNANVAKVNSDGRVTAVNGGVCRIYAIANDGVRASVKVKVIGQPQKLSFAKGSYTVKQGKTLNLAKQVKVKPEGLECALGWTSSDPAIATVTANGVVKGVKKGQVTITVAAENGRKASVTVKVK